MLGRQRLIKVVSAIAVSVLSGGAAWGMTSVASSHSSRVAATEVDSSTSSSVDETSSTGATTSTTEETTTTDDSTSTTRETPPSVAAPTSTPATCNHGADVSRVAHEAPRGHGNEHGKAVSEAAHQKCEHAADAAGQDEQGAAEQHDGKSHKPDDANETEGDNGDSGRD